MHLHRGVELSAMTCDENGRIIRATELEMLELYTARRGAAVMSFDEFKRRLIRQGTEIVKNEPTEK